MALLIVLRLHPVEPVDGVAFTSYLEGLSIKVWDLATGSPLEGVVVGTAAYVAPPDPNVPWDPDPNTRIVQHFSPPFPAPLRQAVATAVVEALEPPGHLEHATNDLRLEITRGGGSIVHRQVYFNVPHVDGDLDPNNFPGFAPSLYLALPAVALDGADFFDLPADGTPPQFDGLVDAVKKVLGNDPGDANALASLTAQQARHVAYEIVWNRTLRPLPELPVGESLEAMYTGKKPDSDAAEQARKKFEGEQQAYYATGNAEAERLAGFVFALSAAVNAETKSAAAAKAGLGFPVLPGVADPNTGARYRQAKVILTGVETLPNPGFSVPAMYFYVLGASLPVSVPAEQRYRLATLAEEDHVRTTWRTAIIMGVLPESADSDSGGIPYASFPGPEVNINQAARRLRSLGAATGPALELTVTTVQVLVQAWLDYKEQDIASFWDGPPPVDTASHLELVLWVLTGKHQLLIDKIKAGGITNVGQLVNWTIDQWRQVFLNQLNELDDMLFPPFIVGDNSEQRFAKFIKHVQKFFLVDTDIDDPDPPKLGGPPQFRALSTDPLTLFVNKYGSSFTFGGNWDEILMLDAVAQVFPDDADARAWLEQLIRAIDELTWLAQVVPPDLAFSVMEALYARGFTSRAQVQELSLDDFRTALTGTVAYEHADAIYAAAGGTGPGPGPAPGPFVPVNPEDCLVNCIPPPQLSPLGPVQYLHELLKLTKASTCAEPALQDESDSLGYLVSIRRGPLGSLLASASNLLTPLPLIDLVNECLEAIADDVSNYPVGVVHDTHGSELGGHVLGDSPAAGHDPTTMFAALPEHSTPATPVAAPDAYVNLSSDFSAPLLPYAQPLDINRSYLGHLRTSRYATMRRFRRDITELVLDPAKEPAEFQKHLWRYPVRIDIAREYLHITPTEYELLYTQDIVNQPTQGYLLLWELYGFPAETVGGTSWIQIVVRLPEFLKRTGLSYCEFLELWRSQFVTFHTLTRREERDFPDCEPCDLDYPIIFTDLTDHVEALRRLAVFIRLWRTLRALPGGGYSFATLRDICEVLHLFNDDGTINPDFVRQLAAFQILRDDFALALTDGSPPVPGTTGAARTHLLALWVGIGATKWAWALDELLDQVQWHAQARHRCGCRPPEFLKLLAENLDPLSRLAGFDPDEEADTWHALPTHTLRFAEVLAKIYASDFGIGEILLLFTTADHLGGDDPFPLQPPNEAIDSPLDLPDDETPFSLWELRRKLLNVDVSDEDAQGWSWARISTTLRGEFGFAPPSGGPDPLLVLGEHYFPSILEASGYPVPVGNRQYRTDLALSLTAPLMWNTPPEGPFRYDAAAEQLWTELALTDEAVIAKLSRIRQLKPEEQKAVRELYFRPRADLAPFAFVFTNFGEAQERLIQEPDEATRWAYFQREFALCYARCQLIAAHLAGHVAEWTGRADAESPGLAWALLRHLFADENRATTSWESDSGQPPQVTWPNQPSGGAFAALLGLTGTGLLGELTPEGQVLVWREVRGPMEAFGAEENAANVQIPTVLPSLGLTLTYAQELFVSARNGFALANPDGALLGGAQGFTATWTGLLLVDTEGTYEFRAGAPTPDGEAPDFAAAADKRWLVQLRRGQRSWVLLSHDWPDETASGDCSAPLPLRRGVYQLAVEFTQPQPVYDGPEDVCPITGGFQVKYAGPDSDGRIVTIPHERLFQDRKDNTLADGLRERQTGAATDFLKLQFTSTMRDVRRTYLRAFTALLFAHRFQLSAAPIADDGQSEIGYLLAHAEDFTGTSYYRQGSAFTVHRAFFDLNFLPVKDNFHPPGVGQDRRVRPTTKRRQALFDWWERIFDYTIVRRDAQPTPERPLWFLFHEAAENHPDDPAHLLRHMRVDLLHTQLLLRYFAGFSVSSADLEDERWTVRAWHTETWVRALRKYFLVRDIRDARPDLWASDQPGELVGGETQTGNQNLTRFLRDGCIENGDPRRYEDIKRLNDGLRERGRAALLAYLCGMDRVPLPWGGFVTEPAHLSELLLLDVQAGLCQRASRIEEAISAVQLFVQRARLGLEPGFTVPPAFALLWERRFSSYRVWEVCTRRETYPENWVDWDELEQARRTETFQFLEAELRRATLTVPVPGGLECWTGHRPPTHPGLIPLQAREPAHIQGIDPEHHGLDLLGTPERHARLSWLAALGLPTRQIPDDTDHPQHPQEPPGEVEAPSAAGLSGVPPVPDDAHSDPLLPMWIKAAIRLGVQFLRIAAAGEPPASTGFAPQHPADEPGCCVECGKPHPVVVDEYYFWMIDSRSYLEQDQDAGWKWHEKDKVPKLLHWGSEPSVHLVWCRVHDGQFMQPRRSHEGVRVKADTTPELTFDGRTSDSLYFTVDGGIAPDGHDDPTPPGFRYDMVADTAVPLPLVVPPEPQQAVYPGALPAYPYFAYFAPGARLMPPSLFAPALAVAAVLRAHCQFQAALKWYELFFAPLHSDSSWQQCGSRRIDDDVEVSAGLTLAGDPPPQQRSLVLHYLETMLQWGDAVLRRNTPEAFQLARLIYDTMAKLLGSRPRTILAEPHEGPTVIDYFVPFAPPINPRLMALYDHSADRLALIHACLNAARLRHGTPNKDMPYWGTSPLRYGWQHTAQACLDDADWCSPHSPYRFVFLVQKALELANEVRGLGAALLGAYEKGDAEYLASLRATHERQLLNLALQIRQNQWRESDWQVQALQKTKEIAQTRRKYYATLIQNGLNSGESDYEALTAVSLASRTAANVVEAIAQAMGAVPDIWFGIAGFGGTPLFYQQMPLGTKLSGVFATAARIANGLAEIAGTTAGLRLTQGGWDRREEEWHHQVEVLDIEIEQIERQILAAERRRDMSLRELNNHQRQIEQSAEVHDFLRDKFTSHDLYLHLQQETAALHQQTYELALHTARQAQRAFNYERGHTARVFLPEENWDSLRENLQAGDRLQLALRQMEHAYLDENLREYELVKHFSLRRDFPLQFLQLQATGEGEIELAEWMFDLDYSHYLRRIKNVSLTIPCVVGPYTGVHSRLTLLSSSTRVSPELTEPAAVCCSECRAGKPHNGYLTLPDDPRIVKEYVATEAIATSTGQNDTGMFELNFRDERKLPFEFRGAVSRWRIEMWPENNQFDLDTVADVVLHLNYTAREGGDIMRHSANEIAQRHLPGAGLRYFDIRHDMPEAWHQFHNHQPAHHDTSRRLPLRLSRAMFPYLPGKQDIQVNRIELFFETPCTQPSEHHLVEFFEPQDKPGHHCDADDVHCVASAEWPGLYHGVLDNIDLGPLPRATEKELGTFHFPTGLDSVSRVFLFCQYHTT